MKTILLGLVILGSSACLGDDPDHLDAVNSGVTLSAKVGTFGAVPSGFHSRLLRTIGTDPTTPSQQTANVPVTLLSDWAMTIDAPELCAHCTVSLLRDKVDILTEGGATDVITVWDDARGLDLCRISLQLNVNAKTVILADTCGQSTADTSPPSWGGARQ